MMSGIPNAVLEYFAADPIDPLLNFAHVADNTDSPVPPVPIICETTSLLSLV